MPDEAAASADLKPAAIHRRRERVFLLLAAIFIGAMAMLNILGITKFIRLGPLELAVGVLPYPLTFLCTDFISELYGRRRANFVVVVGLVINLIVLGFVWLGDALPAIDVRTPDQRIVTMDYLDAAAAGGAASVDPDTGSPLVRPAVPRLDAAGGVVTDAGGNVVLRPVESFAYAPAREGGGAAILVDAESGQPIFREEMLFDRIARMTRQAMLASMIAYLFAQFIDVWLFHFWKRLTRGRWLWLRNNGSTMLSQLVDTVCVVLITFWVQIMAGEITLERIFWIIVGSYAFKFTAALLDTIPFYIGVAFLSRYLRINPRVEHEADIEFSMR